MHEDKKIDLNDIHFVSIPNDKLPLVLDLISLTEEQLNVLDAFIQIIKEKNNEQM